MRRNKNIKKARPQPLPAERGQMKPRKYRGIQACAANLGMEISILPLTPLHPFGIVISNNQGGRALMK